MNAPLRTAIDERWQPAAAAHEGPDRRGYRAAG